MINKRGQSNEGDVQGSGSDFKLPSRHLPRKTMKNLPQLKFEPGTFRHKSPLPLEPN
jgi:hypothetical protein